MLFIQLIIPLLSLSINVTEAEFSQGGWKSISILVTDSSQYSLYLPWLVQNTLTVSYDNEFLVKNQDFSWIDSSRSLIISADKNWIQQNTLKVKYQSAKITDNLTYHIFAFSELQDSLYKDKIKGYTNEITLRPSDEINPFADWGGVHRYGSISRGIRIRGSETTLSSGLHLEMSGKLNKGATIEALIDDRDISATNTDGSSTFSELDKIYFNYSTPTLKAELGDIDIDWQSSNYGGFKRQLKGGSVSLNLKDTEFNLVAAGNDYTYHSIMINGRSGDHGPYELTNKSGIPNIRVSPGSESVFLNGKKVQRGYDGSYLIDYRRGLITFTPMVLINSDSRIEVEYQYSETNYAGYFFAGRALSTQLADMQLSINIATIIEGDDDDQPLFYEWTDEMKQSVSLAGDVQFLAVISGIDSVGAENGDYYYNSVGKERRLVFSPPDSLGHPTGYLSVVYSPNKSGEYVRLYNSHLQTFYFEWAETDAEGERWAPTRPIPLPKRLIHNDIMVSHSVGAFSSQSEVAISSLDLNTISKRDDNDNLGVAWRWKGSWGDRNSDSFHAAITAQNRENNYQSPDRSVDTDYNYHWNLPDSVSTGERSIVTKLQLKPTGKFTTHGEAGYLRQGNSIEVSRLGISSEYLWNDWQISSGHQQVLRNNLGSNSEFDFLKWNADIIRNFKRVGTSYSFNRDTFTQGYQDSLSSGTNRDNHSILIKSDINQSDEMQLRTEYFDENRTVSEQYENWSDTCSLSWSWRRKRSQHGGWNVDIRRSLTTYSDINSARSISTNARIDAVHSFSVIPLTIQTNYSLLNGNDRISTTVATFVGDNLGGYRREDDRYVPDPNGDFNLSEAITDTISSVGKVNFSSRIAFGNNAFGIRDNDDSDHWLDFKGATIKLEAKLTTAANNTWKTYALHPTAFSGDKVISSRVMILQDFDFSSENRAYDSRVSLNWEENTDKNSYGGEINNAQSVSIAQRVSLNQNVKLELLPSFAHNSRKIIIGNELRSDIYTSEGQINVTLQPTDSPLESGLSFRYTSRKDETSLQTAIIKEWKPWINYRFKTSGSIRLDGAWLRLSSNNNRAWYDIDRGWHIGNNYKLNLSIVRQIHDHVSVNFYYRGLWVGKNSPRHEGLLEFTATL